MLPFLNGVSACASFIAGVLFMRFYQDTADRLFMWFAFAFWMLAAHWAAVSIVQPPNEARHLFYILRLVGFVLILVAVIEKNRAARPKR